MRGDSKKKSSFEKSLSSLYEYEEKSVSSLFNFNTKPDVKKKGFLLIIG
jgi:hypothetical protein